jgi:hypothetical protein
MTPRDGAWSSRSSLDDSGIDCGCKFKLRHYLTLAHASVGTQRWRVQAIAYRDCWIQRVRAPAPYSYSSLSRSKIRFAVCCCFAGRFMSSSRSRIDHPAECTKLRPRRRPVRRVRQHRSWGARSEPAQSTRPCARSPPTYSPPQAPASIGLRRFEQHLAVAVGDVPATKWAERLRDFKPAMVVAELESFARFVMSAW